MDEHQIMTQLICGNEDTQTDAEILVDFNYNFDEIINGE